MGNNTKIRQNRLTYEVITSTGINQKVKLLLVNASLQRQKRAGRRIKNKKRKANGKRKKLASKASAFQISHQVVCVLIYCRIVPCSMFSCLPCWIGQKHKRRVLLASITWSTLLWRQEGTPIIACEKHCQFYFRVTTFAFPTKLNIARFWKVSKPWILTRGAGTGPI